MPNNTPDAYNIDFTYLRALRIRHGLTFAQLAERSGIPESTLKHMSAEIHARGSCGCRLDTLYRLCVALGASMDIACGLPSDLVSSTQRARADALEAELRDMSSRIHDAILILQEANDNARQ